MSVLLSLLLLASSPVTDAEKEAFLKEARVVSIETIPTGVTKPIKARLEKGGVEHSAQIQSNDTDLPPFFGVEGRPGIPMRDSWRYNIAAYRLDRLLGTNRIPVSVTRTWQTKPSAFTWWVEDIKMDEAGRLKNNIEAPNRQRLEKELADAKVFDELILNIDRNLGNLLYTKDWNVVLIDHTRSFVAWDGIRNPDNLNRCSRRMLDGMKRLTEPSLRRALGDVLTPTEIRSLLARRNKIVARFSGEGAKDVF